MAILIKYYVKELERAMLRVNYIIPFRDELWLAENLVYELLSNNNTNRSEFSGKIISTVGTFSLDHEKVIRLHFQPYDYGYSVIQ